MIDRFWIWLSRLLPRKRKWSEYAYSRRIWGHSQNLSDGKWRLWRYGRAWLHLWSKQIGLEWHFLSKNNNFVFGFAIGGEESHQLQFQIAIPYLCSLFLSFEGFLHFKDWRYWGTFGRETGVKIHNGTIWLAIWFNDMEVHFSNWLKISGWNIHLDNDRGFMISFTPADFFLGRPKHIKRSLEKASASVVLPEGEYPVMVEIFESIWMRPRWPWPTKMIRADIDCGKNGIPAHAGKGENAWDLDDDFVFSMTCPETTPESAASRLADSIMRDRKRYGLPTMLLAERFT